MTDIVERLRRDAGHADSVDELGEHTVALLREAADEIELARAALVAMVGFTKTKVADGMVDNAPELEAVRTYLRHT